MGQLDETHELTLRQLILTGINPVLGDLTPSI